MFVILVDWRVAPGDSEVFATLLVEQAATSLEREVDCLTFDICQDPSDPGAFTLYEVYTDAEAFDVHLASEHMARFAAQAEPLTVVKTVRKLEELKI